MATIPKVTYFDCVEHGTVVGDHCVICSALGYVRRVREGKILAKVLAEGRGPYSSDPSPLSIRFRAFLERKRSEEERGHINRNASRHWRRKKRIVRIFPDLSKS